MRFTNLAPSVDFGTCGAGVWVADPPAKTKPAAFENHAANEPKICRRPLGEAPGLHHYTEAANADQALPLLSSYLKNYKTP
jgi:hypothetical protein